MPVRGELVADGEGDHITRWGSLIPTSYCKITSISRRFVCDTTGTSRFSLFHPTSRRHTIFSSVSCSSHWAVRSAENGPEPTYNGPNPRTPSRLFLLNSMASPASRGWYELIRRRTVSNPWNLVGSVGDVTLPIRERSPPPLVTIQNKPLPCTAVPAAAVPTTVSKRRHRSSESTFATFG